MIFLRNSFDLFLNMRSLRGFVSFVARLFAFLRDFVSFVVRLFAEALPRSFAQSNKNIVR